MLYPVQTLQAMLDTVLYTVFKLTVSILMRLYFYFEGSPSLKSPKSFCNFTKLCVGHRGCRGMGFPENSMGAFRYAIDHGAEALELDCRLSKDGKIVVMHDNTVDRVLKGTGHVKNLRLDEIQRMPYLQCNSASLVHTHRDGSEEVTPEVHDVYKLCKENNVRLFIEAKDLFDSPRTLAKELALFFREHEEEKENTDRHEDKKSNSVYDIACIICFNPLLCYYLRALNPKIITCLLYSECTIQSAVKAGNEDIPILLQNAHISRWMDRFMYDMASQNDILHSLGVSLVGPNVKDVNAEMIDFHDKNNRGVYTWTMNTPSFVSQLQYWKVSYGTDCVFPRLQKRGGVGEGDSKEEVDEYDYPTFEVKM